jgi:hypothetical protein
MADQINNGSASVRAALILAGAALVHYGYALAPAEMQARLWNIGGAAGRLALLVSLLWALRVRGLALLAGAWWAAEESLVIGCNAAFLWRPWPVEAGQAACTGLLGLDLSALGALVAALLAVALSRK